MGLVIKYKWILFILLPEDKYFKNSFLSFSYQAWQDEPVLKFDDSSREDQLHQGFPAEGTC